MSAADSPQLPALPQFPTDRLEELRTELLRAGLDTRHAAELLTAFLAEYGYGASQADARQAVPRLEAAGCRLPRLQTELASLALMM